MNSYSSICNTLNFEPKTWLVTGVAGFIGSNILERLLKLNQKVVGLDNFSTGHESNLADVKNQVSKEQWANFTFYNGDIRNLNDCKSVCIGTDYVLHQAALGSVPRSIIDPMETHSSNVDGFINMLIASRDAGVKSFTYASSSSVYGDHPNLPKIESHIGQQLSPYAVTKFSNELYAGVFSKCYGLKCIGLRYFNVFGKRQDPNGAYAAVIPRWASAMLNDKKVVINGDGETSRDFCFVENTVQMNILAATATDFVKDEVYNVAVGKRTTLNQLFLALQSAFSENLIEYHRKPIHQDFRQGDIQHSLADISKAQKKLGYDPEFFFEEGISLTVKWYLHNRSKL